MQRVVLVGFQLAVGLYFLVVVHDFNFTHGTVYFKSKSTHALFVRFGHINELEQKLFSFADFQSGFFAFGKTVEIYVAFQAGNVVVRLKVFAVIFVHLRIESVADGFLLHLVVGEGRHVEFLSEHGFDLLEVNRRKQSARADSDRLLSFQHDGLKLFREAAVRLSHHAPEVIHHGIRIGESSSLFKDVIFIQAVFQHEDGEVAHRLGRRRYLDDVSEKVVGLFIKLLDLFEAVGGAHLRNLRQQVGILTARNLVFVDFGVRRVHLALKCLVELADASVITAQFI